MIKCGSEAETPSLKSTSVSQSSMSLAMTSSQSIAVSVVLGLGLGSVSVAWADSASDACAALANARTALYSMINAKEKSVQDALNAKVQEASTKLDSVLAGMTGADAKAAAPTGSNPSACLRCGASCPAK
jgi:hypothetical protein